MRMSYIILQPAAATVAAENYSKTISKGVPLDTLARFLNKDLISQLAVLYPDRNIPTWGVMPGFARVNVPKWKRIQAGDITLFTGNNKVFASGTVTLKVHSKALARELWGSNSKNNDTWEYIFFLDEIKERNISYQSLNKVADYATNNIIQGFSVLSPSKSEAIIRHFDLLSEVYLPPITEDEFEQSINALDSLSELDKQVMSSSRTEQAFLRNSLFRDKRIDRCVICCKDYPVGFLVAAHIKKRNICSDLERRDYKNIVTPMCKFGCDELYEKGYIGVDAGQVVLLMESDKATTDTVVDYLNSVAGNRCTSWNDKTMKYFEWHNNPH